MRNWIVPEFQRSVTKQPSEEIMAICDFSDRILPYFGKLVSATFSAVKWPILDPDNKSDGSDLFADGTSGLIEFPYLTHAKIKVHEGDVDHDYHITCLAVNDTGESVERDFIVRVRET